MEGKKAGSSYYSFLIAPVRATIKSDGDYVRKNF